MPPDAADLRFFAALASAGSMAEAARRMDITPSAVSQRLRQLEARMGLRLVNRSTRRFNLTEEGELFRAGAAELLAGIDDLTDRLRSRVGTVAGTLDVCGPLGFGRRYLAPAVAEFRTLHPALQISLTLTDEVPAADPRQFDLIVHIGRLADSSMVACVVAANRRFLCASPDYLARRPAPRLPQDLTAHDCIVLRENREDVTLWRFRKRGQEVSVRVPAVLASNEATSWASGRCLDTAW